MALVLIRAINLSRMARYLDTVKWKVFDLTTPKGITVHNVQEKCAEDMSLAVEIMLGRATIILQLYDIIYLVRGPGRISCLPAKNAGGIYSTKLMAHYLSPTLASTLLSDQ